MATAKHKFQQLVFNPVNQKLIDFLDEPQKLAKDAFGVAAQAIIDQFIFAKMPPSDRKSRTLYPPCETCGKENHSTERCYVGANAANRPLPWKNKPQEQDAYDSITGCVQATAQHFYYKCHIFTPEQWLTDRIPTEEYSTNPMCCLAATSGDICG